MADEAQFISFNIGKDQEITTQVREDAKKAYRDALDSYWKQSDSEFIDDMGRPIDKPDSLTDWQYPGDLKKKPLGQIPRYADLDKKIQQLDNFFTTATDEEIRKALQPPNDMGKFAEKALKDILLEKNKQDNRFTGGLPPDTEARKNNEIIQEQEKQLSEEEKAAMAKKAAEAKKKAAEQTNEAMKSVQPAKSLEFKQQNFLQAKLLDIIRHRRAPGSPDSIPPQKTYPYVEGAPNSSIMLFGDPATTVNDLFVYPDTETFFQMRTEEISALQPEIRFFKAITDSESGKEVNVPIHFDTSLTSNSLESLLVSRKKRGTGVGLQEFKLGFVGVDVFSANKAFTADVTIFANSLEELFKPRGEKGRRYRYVDMAMKTGTKPNEAVQNRLNAQKSGVLEEDLENLDFAIKVKVGVRAPKNTVNKRAALGSISALARNSLTLHMTPTIHEFNFNDDGSVVFKIKYVPYKNTRLSGNSFDVFTNTSTVKREIDFKINNTLFKKQCDPDKISALKKDHMEEIKLSREDSIASIIKNLHAEGKVNYLQLHPEVLKKFHDANEHKENKLSMAEIFELSKGAEFVGAEGKELKDKIKENLKKELGKVPSYDPVKKKVNSPTINTVSYIFLSDIIDAVLASITKSISPQELATVVESVNQETMEEIKNTNSKLKDLRAKEEELKKALLTQQREVIQKARTASGDLKEFSGTDAGTILDYYMTNHPDVMNDVIDVSDLDAEWQIENLKDEMATVKADQEDMVLKAQLAHEIIKEYKNTFEDFRKFRVLLGSIELVNPFDESDVLIASLGDIPLSLPYFQDWLVSETLKNNSKRMPLTSFLNKLVSKAVSSALNDDSMFGGMLKQKVRIGKTEVKCNNQYQEKIDDLTFLMLQTNKNLKDNFATYLKVKFGFDGLMDQWSEMSDGEKQKVQDAIGIEPRTSYAFINGLTSPVLEPAALGEDPLRDGATDREMDYLLFFQNRTAPIGTYKGDRLADAERGIHHYSIGRDRGIIKDIKLTRDNRKGIQEARYEQSGFVGLGQLGMVYNVDINCFVNFNVFPGTQIFVDPAGWVPNLDSETLGELGSLQALTHFGLGGYYCVVGVDHTFGPGIFDSQIKAKWVMEIDSPNKPRYPEKPSKQSNNKCKEAAGSLAAAASRADESAIKSVGAELAAIPSRVKALAMSAIDLVAGGETGELVDKAASLFGNPSSAP